MRVDRGDEWAHVLGEPLGLDGGKPCRLGLIEIMCCCETRLSSEQTKRIDMPITKLTGPVAAYVVAANGQDVNAVTACFAEDAVVRDEGQSRHGITAIRRWAEEVKKKYRPTLDIIDVVETKGRTIVCGRVSGGFPGGPIELRYAFTLDGEKIASLEIS